jgi:hypothetical protein
VLAALLVMALFLAPRAFAADVQINEFQTAGTLSGDQWVDLYNPNASCVRHQ